MLDTNKFKILKKFEEGKHLIYLAEHRPFGMTSYKVLSKNGSEIYFSFKCNEAEKYFDKHIALLRNPINPYQIGDIVYESWGYEQTNIDFFQVVKTTKARVYLRELKDNAEYSEPMIGNKTPIKDNFENEEVICRGLYLFRLDFHIRSERGAFLRWDEEPVGFTSYC